MTAVKPEKRPREEGQWALGSREPLNTNEQTKKDDNPLNVRARIESTYAEQGFESAAVVVQFGQALGGRGLHGGFFLLDGPQFPQVPGSGLLVGDLEARAGGSLGLGAGFVDWSAALRVDVGRCCGHGVVSPLGVGGGGRHRPRGRRYASKGLLR